MNGVTGEVDGNTSLNNLLLCNTLLELDDMSMTVLGDALKADDLAEVVMIRPEEQLNSSWVVDKAVLEDTTKAFNARSGSEILKIIQIHSTHRWLSLVTSCQRRHPWGYLQIEGSAMRLTWFRNEILRNSAVVSSKRALTLSSVPNTRLGWCMRAMSESQMEIGRAFNKLNAARIPAQTPIPRNDVL
ncbi:reverse transcriptase [Phytophthora megakarya]|uniref:Reverse transcriptase n=1 Tax=Phytophthora megakarya TaxID=4795 RepID=A0A225VXE3_9STRA|nr:reverse transcriptase [Phytophthora megakarya]